MVIQGVSAPGQNPAYRPSAHFLSAGKGALAAARLLPGVRAAPAPLRRGPPGAFCREETALAGCRSRAGRMGGLTAKRDTLLPWRFAPPGGGHRPCHSTVLILAQPGAKAPGQRPPGRALASVHPGPAGLQGTVPRGRGNAGRVSWSRPNRRRHFHRFNGRGHRPCHSATLASGPAGGQSPRPAPAPPPAGASPPPGRALASVPPGPAGLQGHRRVRAGKRAAFPVPARRGEGTAPASMAGAIAPATAPR